MQLCMNFYLYDVARSIIGVARSLRNNFNSLESYCTIIIKKNMEILNESYSVLTNFEVMEALSKQTDSKKKYGLRNLATICYETMQYLDYSTCKHQNHQSIVNFLEDIRSYKLSEEECVMVVNDPPTVPLHIQLLIDGSEERLSDEQVTSLLELSKRHFPRPLKDSN